MLHAVCGRIIKVQQRTILMKILRRQVNFWDKGRAEENIYYMKQQREQLIELAKKLADMEKSLDANIKKLEKFTDEEEKKQDPFKGKKSPNDRN